jgi:hypothetical protein
MSRPTARVAYLAAALNAIAAVAMLLVLREGLPVPGASVDTRIEFINHHRALWNAGWLTWHLAALSLVALYAVLALRWLPTRRLESVLGLAGKVLGPIGLGQLILSGAWPPRTLVLSIANDFI